ncbi:prepilin-type N-terminal cleavage/methylation domain-containing protein [Shewanella sp. AS16]|uniref:type II secretion system protein n=1 Tax=Shewanella sp. AS16 TaxID=2907625 RepID=UPI001F37BD8C|nr:prepilin-type N-terminal cleavage/methylation domain-containing protein [Shewanella sp. AS16]MCE9685914.1 prepilin-type N-terminal cleavage/methylation domain-containing protein [Shewanella sp. AS16]
MYAASPSKQRGFTLVELVTTILLIAILAVAVLPRLLGTSAYSAFSLRNEFIAELRRVQLQALNNTDRCFRVAVSSTGYRLQQFPGRSGKACSGTVLDTDAEQRFQGGASLALLAFNGQNFNLDFDADGRSSLNCNGNCIEVRADDTLMIAISSEGYIYAN